MCHSGTRIRGKLRGVRSLGGSVRERHESRCVFPLARRRYPSVCVPRGMWNETGAGADRGHGDHDCKLRVHEVPEACNIVVPALVLWDSRLRLFVVGGNPSCRVVVFPIQELDCWKGDRRSQEGERRRNEKSCNVKWRMTQLKD